MHNTKQTRINKRGDTFYIILNISVIIIMIYNLFEYRIFSALLCAVTLLLLYLPRVICRKLCVCMPKPFEIILYLFIFGSEILGETWGFYLKFRFWDSMLHLVCGFLMAAVGYTMIRNLNKGNTNIKLSPLFLFVTTLCFSVTIGVLWEFFEFFMDIFFKTDMQKDKMLSFISSVSLNPDNINKPVFIPVRSLHINDSYSPLSGYLDIGLYDTMKDLLVNFIGAAAFSVVCYFYITKGKFVRFIEKIVPVRNK